MLLDALIVILRWMVRSAALWNDRHTEQPFTAAWIPEGSLGQWTLGKRRNPSLEPADLNRPCIRVRRTVCPSPSRRKLPQRSIGNQTIRNVVGHVYTCPRRTATWSAECCGEDFRPAALPPISQ
jgi:hypothetical protein